MEISNPLENIPQKVRMNLAAIGFTLFLASCKMQDPRPIQSTPSPTPIVELVEPAPSTQFEEGCTIENPIYVSESIRNTRVRILTSHGYASGFLMKIDDEIFVITAGHVLRDMDADSTISNPLIGEVQIDISNAETTGMVTLPWEDTTDPSGNTLLQDNIAIIPINSDNISAGFDNGSIATLTMGTIDLGQALGILNQDGESSTIRFVTDVNGSVIVLNANASDPEGLIRNSQNGDQILSGGASGSPVFDVSCYRGSNIVEPTVAAIIVIGPRDYSTATVLKFLYNPNSSEIMGMILPIILSNGAIDISQLTQIFDPDIIETQQVNTND
jgi:hypothetical protein